MGKKIIISTLLLGFITVFIHSCSDDFLTKRWEDARIIFINTQTIYSIIYVFPNESAIVYPIVCEDAGNATFTIVNKPDWLKVESMNGQFTNGIAELTCSAIRNELFTEPRIYLVDMIIEVDGVGRGLVDVGYNNGVPVFPYNPIFFCDGMQYLDFSIDFEKTKNMLTIGMENRGSGVLIWKVKERPEWITMTTQDFLDPMYHKMMEITCNRSGLPKGNYEGIIILSTNDRDQPTYSITVRCQVGDE